MSIGHVVLSCLPENQCLQDEFTISKGGIEVKVSLVDSDVFANDRPGGRDLGENDLSVGNHCKLLLVMKREKKEEVRKALETSNFIWHLFSNPDIDRLLMDP
jgi:hypothetical protein